ncbi:MAG: hypothetical protein VYE22_39860 [Myxococcota bacterium]|nr:hypothetical protein [Myxococcota bacterium]
MRRLVSLFALLALGGCTLVVDGEVGELRPNQNAKRDVRVDLRDFTPHVGQLVDVKIVNPETNGTLAHAVIDALPSDCANLFFPRGAEAFADRVDFFADLNGNGVLDQAPTDHSWRLRLNDEGRLLYVHDVDFTNIGEDEPAVFIGEPLQLTVTGAGAFDGQRVVASVIRSDLIDPEMDIRADTVPGIYVLGAIEGGTIAFELEGVIDAGRVHNIELAIGDGATRCETSATAPDSGPLTLELDLSTLDCDDRPPRMAFEDCGR